MHTEIKHLAKLFKGVRDIREVVKQDCHFPDMEATSIDDLHRGFEAYFGKRIKFYVVPDLKDELLRGLYLLYEDNRVDIYLDKDLPDNWLKYIQVKEMCNLILEDEEYKTDDPTTLLELMIYEETTPLDGDAPLDLVSDFWSRYAAHELLFPFECRAGAMVLLKNGESLFSLGEKFGIPEHVIGICLSEKYHDLCKRAWEMVDSQ